MLSQRVIPHLCHCTHLLVSMIQDNPYWDPMSIFSVRIVGVSPPSTPTGRLLEAQIFILDTDPFPAQLPDEATGLTMLMAFVYWEVCTSVCASARCLRGVCAVSARLRTSPRPASEIIVRLMPLSLSPSLTQIARYPEQHVWWAAGVVLRSMISLVILPQFFLIIIDYVIPTYDANWAIMIAVLQLFLRAFSQFTQNWFARSWPIRDATCEKLTHKLFSLTLDQLDDGRLLNEFSKYFTDAPDFVANTYDAITSLLENTFRFCVVTSYMSTLTDPPGVSLAFEGLVILQLLLVYAYRKYGWHHGVDLRLFDTFKRAKLELFQTWQETINSRLIASMTHREASCVGAIHSKIANEREHEWNCTLVFSFFLFLSCLCTHLFFPLFASRTPICRCDSHVCLCNGSAQGTASRTRRSQARSGPWR